MDPALFPPDPSRKPSPCARSNYGTSDGAASCADLYEAARRGVLGYAPSLHVADSEAEDYDLKRQPPLGQPDSNLEALAYATPAGQMYLATIEEALDRHLAEGMEARVQLILTSPPFPLNRKKSYGNLNGEDYQAWLVNIFSRLVPLLTPTGSIVVELGNSWVAGAPEMSTLPLESLLTIKKNCGLHLCQQFVLHNPARLPNPVQWVNIERIRLKDSFTNVWWLSPTVRPKANNRHVLDEYSKAMKRLLKTQSYNAGPRPSGYEIGAKSFLRDNGGAIPSNVLISSNTGTAPKYRHACKELGVPLHPARMQPDAVSFFIKLLTDEKELVMDPFAGSNTTGAIAEILGRQWISVEVDPDFVRGSTGHFENYSWKATLPLVKGQEVEQT